MSVNLALLTCSPLSLDPEDIGFKLAGAGDPSRLLCGHDTITRAAINEGFDAETDPELRARVPGRHPPLCGCPRSPARGGVTGHAPTARAGGVQRSQLDEVRPSIPQRGTIIYDSSVISAVPSDLAAGVTTAAVPFTSIAKDLGALS